MAGKVYGRLDALKRDGESITERESTERVAATLTNDNFLVDVFMRADGRTSIRVKSHDGKYIHDLDLNADGTLSPYRPALLDGKAVAL